MATDRLYYRECYLSQFDAEIIEATDDDCRVYLNRTAFYPTSGGQPNDFGALNDVAVLDVIDEGDRIVHVVAAPVANGGVQGKIDWQRRYDHMQQHTGQHLVSAVFVELYQFPTLSFHLGAEISTVELRAKDLTEAQVGTAEERANEIVREARRVNIFFEEADAVENLRKPSARTGTLRIIEIEGLDRSACGGTHVRSTAETGPILIRKSEKIRGNVRIEFVCGSRAIRRARQEFRIISALARQEAVGFERLPEQVASLRQRLTDAEKALQKTTLELARREGDALYQATEPSSDGVRRAMMRVSAIDDASRAKTQGFASHSRAVALAIASEPPGVLIAVSADLGLNAGAILKEVLGRAGARGGGSATLAQGSLPNEDVARELMQALGIKS